MDKNQGNLSLSKLIDFAKQQKEFVLSWTESGDLPPTVLVERYDALEAIIMSPDIDKNLALQAAALAKLGFDPDSLILIFDARMTQTLDKKNYNEAIDDFQNKYPYGLQNVCESNKSQKDIVDCLICYQINRHCEIQLAVIPYEHKSKQNKRSFEWLDNKMEYNANNKWSDQINLSGFIPDSLKQIMSSKKLFEQVPALKDLAENYGRFSEEKARFHAARAVVSLLLKDGFMVTDLISGKHPEWTEASEVAEKLLDKLIDEGLLKEEARTPILDMVNSFIGTTTFSEKMVEFFKENLHLFEPFSKFTASDKAIGPDDLIAEFVDVFQTACIHPNLNPFNEG